MCITGVCQAPQSFAKIPIAMQWLAMRCSSHMIVRRYCARSGTSMPASFSTASSSQVAGHRREVVHAVGERDVLRVRPLLGQLLHRAVEVAHDHLRVDDPLAVQRQAQAEDAVRARVLRPDVDDERLGLQIVKR